MLVQHASFHNPVMGRTTPPEVMTTEEVPPLFGLHVASVQKMARSGRIPAHRKPGTRRWWYDRDEIIAWLQSRPTGT